MFSNACIGTHMLSHTANALAIGVQTHTISVDQCTLSCHYVHQQHRSRTCDYHWINKMTVHVHGNSYWIHKLVVVHVRVTIIGLTDWLFTYMGIRTEFTNWSLFTYTSLYWINRRMVFIYIGDSHCIYQQDCSRALGTHIGYKKNSIAHVHHDSYWI
jgi:hypothetical protein